jgi:predicted  nucleic acid-binding Zn-ribbon protein
MDDSYEFFQTAWQQEHQRALDAEEKLKSAQKDLEHLDDLQYQLQQLSAELRKVQNQCECLLEENRTYREQQANQEAWEKRLARQDFWRQDFLEIWQQELAELDQAITGAETSADWRELIVKLQQELLSGLEAEHLSGSSAQALRQRLLAQWIYLRFREIREFLL